MSGVILIIQSGDSYLWSLKEDGRHDTIIYPISNHTDFADRCQIAFI